MDSVALFVSKEYALSIIQALKEAREKCENDGRRIMAKGYSEIEDIMRQQYEIAKSVRDNMDRNGGEYKI